jgi:hypothetical protein
MRSSKSRSRSKNNRNRPSGNIVNRVFDSSGPEGKVRGTPSQVIEKYNQLARDAQLAGDRVATENFQQHAEHYTRMLAQAQRELDARRDQQGGPQNQQGHSQQSGGQGGGRQNQRDEATPQGGQQPRERNRRDETREEARPDDRPEGRGPRFRSGEATDDPRGTEAEAADSGLVETPEAREAAEIEAAAKAEATPAATDEPQAEATSEDEPEAKKATRRAPARSRSRTSGTRSRPRAKAPAGDDPTDTPPPSVEEQATGS